MIKEELIKYLSTPEAKSALSSYRDSMIADAITRKQQYEQKKPLLEEYAIRQRLSKTGDQLLTPQEQEMFGKFSEFQALNPVYSGDRGNVYKSADIENMLSGYNAFDVSKFGEDPFSTSLKAKMTMVGDYGYLPKEASEYYTKLASLADAEKLGYYGFGGVTDPYKTAKYNWRYSAEPAFSVSLDNNSGIYIPAEYTTKLWGDKEKGTTYTPYDFLGNENIYKYGNLVSLPDDVTSEILGSLKKYSTDFNFSNPGLGYFMNQDDFNKYVIGANTSNFDTGPGTSSSINTGRGVHNISDLYGSNVYRMTPEIFNNLYLDVDKNAGGLQNAMKINGELPTWFAQSEADPELFYRMSGTNSGSAAYDTYTKKNWAAKALDVISPLATILSFIPVTAPIGMAMNAGLGIGSGLKTGNIGQIAAGALSLPGVGNALTSGIAGKIAPYAGAASPYVASGIVSGGLGALSGQNVLKSALAGGLGSYAGSQISSGLKSTNPMLANVLGKTASGLTSNMVMGNPINSTTTLKNMLIQVIQQGAKSGLKGKV